MKAKRHVKFEEFKKKLDTSNAQTITDEDMHNIVEESKLKIGENQHIMLSIHLMKADNVVF